MPAQPGAPPHHSCSAHKRHRGRLTKFNDPPMPGKSSRRHSVHITSHRLPDDIMALISAAPAISAAFLSSLVEAVEALTIVLSVAVVRGWRPAGLGALAGLASLALIIVGLGPLLDRLPLHPLQLVIGVLLLLFGMRWLRKAILRAAGLISLHDQALAFATETAALREQAPQDNQRL